MIKDIQHSNGDKFTLLFGFAVIQELNVGQSKGIGEMQLIADCGLVAINTMRSRQGQDLLPKKEYEMLLDDFDFMFDIKEAVEEFSVNFSKKAELRAKKKK